ncbi:MAG: PilW family protein [Desulfobulbaceae bacterium]|nr:PilW family protein [Desulfobulbaceae bacterium]
MDASKMKMNGGYTLVEVMIAMAISLIVLSGVYKTITDETVNAAREEAVLDMQNNARFAMARIAGDLRRTGFFGCGGKLSANTSGYAYPPTAIVFENNGAAADSDLGTDKITLRFLGGDVPLDPTDTTNTTGLLTTKIYTLARKAFRQGEHLLISDCEEYAIFKKTNSEYTLSVEHATPLNSSDDLKRAYGAPLPARVYNFEEAVYRVDGAELRLNGDVIAANIEDLQFEFIEDTDNDGELSDQIWLQTFTSAEKVRAVRVWVLAMSDTAYTYTDDNTYDYPNSPYYSTTDTFYSTQTTFAASNGGGGSPASQATLAEEMKHRYRYLAKGIIYLRNAGI